MKSCRRMSQLVATTIAAVMLLSLAVIFHSHVAEAATTYLINWVPGVSGGQLTPMNVTLGDKINFQYDYVLHDVHQLGTQYLYDKCLTSKGDTMWSSGNDTIQLNVPGWHYFVCGYTQRCVTDGMKIQVNVVKTIRHSI
ncbi:hypothetical protein CASFOL_035805 [Castilleja foliolosa]|uniref:Phytocyanin domain-containing protein n=1 Tax=Castilleja foliolosa TaxID=1961234 RepID=A0ABD3BTR1_9LAMI